ncbi:MAG: hypothetical protein GWN16_03445, partial [Calditrichae bacterium]|nr:hypothetical protein [Calditrichia bacterium]
LLRDTEEFRVYYNDLLAECGYDAFFWENRPVTHQSLDENYECNLIRSNYLATKMADTNTFSQYFDESKNVVTFNNLG